MTGTTNDNDNRKLIALILIWGVILTIVLCSLAGCKTTEYVEVPVTHTEYVYRDRFREIWRTDTLVRCDTVSVVHTEVVEKTVARMNSLQSAFFWLGLLAFFIVIGYVAYRIWRWRFKL